MKVQLYTGGFRLVRQSGIGQALIHQKEILTRAGFQVTLRPEPDVEVVHINTIFPDSPAAAVRAKRTGKKIVYYAHSTREDFCQSFRGSDQLAPLFQRWITACYNLGDVVLTPTAYSRAILSRYGIHPPVYCISNGVDTDFFAPSTDRGWAFRERYCLSPADKVVVSVGHWIARKGLPEFLELARAMPEVRFFWFGYTDPRLIPTAVRNAIAAAPDNVTFTGYVANAVLRDAYCGADAFVFLSHEETEGITVLEALSCGVPVLLRDIPVYNGWLQNGQSVWKAADDFVTPLSGILSGTLPDLTAAGRMAARSRSYDAMAFRIARIYRKTGLCQCPYSALEQARKPIYKQRNSCG